MFWDKGYAPSANIEALLEKENATLEEFLDEEDILQECKTQKKNIVNYFIRPEVIRRLVELITTEPANDVPMSQRFRYANMSCEILTLGLPSLNEKLLSDTDTLQLLYSYLEKEPPLNPLLASFFSKTFSMLFTKKPEQDWFLYQHMCLQLMEYIKLQKNFLDLICKHFDTPVIPDLIMQMMRDIEGGQLKRNLYEWLTEDKLVDRLIAILRNPQETDKHANVAEFFCDLINQGRHMRQTEQENDSFEPAFEGSNPILKTIESAETIEALLNVILEPNALESAILSGISVVLTLIRPITFNDEPNSDRQCLLQKRERKFHLEVQEIVINVMAPRLQEFMHVLKNPPAKPALETTAAVLTPPFGKTRLQVCRVFTALLETKHETIQQAIAATEYFSLMIDYFKEYCWNNFLHSELEKSLHLVFYNHLSTNDTILTDFTENYSKQMTTDDYIFNIFKTEDVASGSTEVEMKNALNDVKRAEGDKEEVETSNDLDIDIEAAETENVEKPTDQVEGLKEDEAVEQKARQEETENQSDETKANESATAYALENHVANAIDETTQEAPEAKLNDLDKTKSPNNLPPTELQTHLIVNCHLASKLIDYWQYNTEQQSGNQGRRLGYMGHLIKILWNLTCCISESEHIGGLVASSFSDENEQKLWQSLIDTEVGEFTKTFKLQSKILANWNPNEETEYKPNICDDMITPLNEWERGQFFSELGLDPDNPFEYFFSNDGDVDLDKEELQWSLSSSCGFASANPYSTGRWDLGVHFPERSGGSQDTNTDNVSRGSAFISDNFADFDSHFSTFGSDLGLPQTELPRATTSTANAQHDATNDDDAQQLTENAADNEDDVQMRTAKQSPDNETNDAEQAEYDNNANVEKSMITSSDKLPDSNAADTNATAITSMAASSIANRLQSVLLDGEEDYEDDEGMWTKPLGGDRHAEEQTGPIQNRPTSKQLAELNNAESQLNDNNSSNSDDDSVGHITAEQQKLAATVAANNIENATTKNT